jgi:hypothetical protein
MEDYLTRPFYPILQINRFDGHLDFQQRASDNSDVKWDIPMFVRNLNAGRDSVIWLKKDGSLCSSEKDPFQTLTNDTFVFNVGGKSFSRLEYGAELWPKLIEKASLIDSVTQYSMVLDLLSGRVDNQDYSMEFVAEIVKQSGALSPILAYQLTSIFFGDSLVGLF